MVSYDASGNIIPGYPLRELNYYDFEFGYDLKLIRGLLISPGLGFLRRVDLYEDYYTYSSFYPNLKVRYMKGKWYVATRIAFKNTNYDEKFAYTEIEATDLLQYAYFKYDLKARYRLTPMFDLFIDFSSDSRDSNSDLDYKGTRRSYNNYELSFGVNAVFNIRKPNIFN